MGTTTKRLFILNADDDAEDQTLFEEALINVNPVHLLHSVDNGDRLIGFLNESHRQGKPMPNVIFLDLNMPVKNGRETLQIIKSENSIFRHIPVIVFTTSSSPLDIEACYRLGANLFVVKPWSFTELTKSMKHLLLLFTGIIELPSALREAE